MTRDPDDCDHEHDARHDRHTTGRSTAADGALASYAAMVLAGTSSDLCSCGHTRGHHPAGYCNRYTTTSCRCMAFADSRDRADERDQMRVDEARGK